MSEDLIARLLDRRGSVPIGCDKDGEVVFGDDHDAVEAAAKLEANRKRIAELEEALRELLVAVRYADPPRDFGTPEQPNLCHEARIPIDFVTAAEAALRTGGNNG